MRTTLASLLLAGLAGPVYADPPPPIELAITGSVDAGVVATSVAAELKRPVESAADACRAPCLNIVVADAKATVVYTSEGGAVRQRTIALGADAKQWPIVITLLAGNLVRDEAADVLALVPQRLPAGPAAVATAPVVPEAPMPPAPPAPEPAQAPPARASLEVHATEPQRWSAFSFGLVPGLSTDLVDLGRSHTFALSLVAGAARDVDGVSIAGAIDVARGTVSGAQVSGAVAVAGDLNGVQLAGAATVARRADGVQVAGAAAYAHQSSSMQVAGAATVTAHDADAQLAGALAYAGRDSDLQIAGAVAVTGRAATTQIAGAVNIAGQLDGIQIAPINIARRNAGLQVGVINLGGGPDGTSIGLISIVPGGRTDLEGAIDSNRVGTLLFRHGSRRWHNVYGIGGQPVSEAAGMSTNDVWMVGLGFGPSFHVGSLPADLEAMGWHVGHGSTYDTNKVSLLSQLRLTIGIPLGPVTLVAGGAINTYVSSDHASPFITARTTTPGDMTATDVTVRIWPSLFVGARL